MDLSKLDVKAAAGFGADLYLKDPFTLEVIEGCTIRLLGRDAGKVNEARRDVDRLMTAGEIDKEEAGLRVLIVATIGWTGIELDGKSLDCTPDNVRTVYTDPRTDWVLEQVGPFSLARRNYKPQTLKG